MRKTTAYTVTDEGRDKGKAFKITEMGAAQAEEWAMRAAFAIMNAGIDVPDDLAQMGMAGIASLSLSALGKVKYEYAKPLLDEMMECVEIIPDPKKPNVSRTLFAEDIEEVKTRLILRKEIFNLHVDFLGDASLSTSGRGAETQD